MALAEETALLDATAQADLVRRGEVTASELVDAAIERIERHNPALNAVITPMFDHARAAARQGAFATSSAPFAGVPFLVKDLIAVCEGARITEGSAFLRDYVAPRDSELAARYRRAGLVFCGKTNTPEFGILPTTEPLRFGPTHNPWKRGVTPGGSSGGAASAVAAGLVPMAHASDGGGSIRIPASCCGLFGLKPTRGRNPLGPDHGELGGGLVVEHAITRSVRDSAALLDATSGPALGDPYAAPPTLRSFAEEARREPGRLRIAFSVASGNGAPVHCDCVEAVHDAAKLCEALGHHVEERQLELEDGGASLVKGFLTLWAVTVASVIDDWSKRLGRTPLEGELEPLTVALAAFGRSRSAPEWVEARSDLHLVSRRAAAFFEEIDVFLLPTLATPPPPHGTFDSQPDNVLAGYTQSAFFCPFTPFANVTGQPAMSVPLMWNGGGLPIGSQFIARFGDEGTLFRLAAQLEAARPWAQRRPPV